MKNKPATTPGLPGFGPTEFQTELLPEYQGAGTRTPLVDLDQLHARSETARLVAIGQLGLVCRRTEDSSGTLYSWFTEAGEDCEVSARTLQTAKTAAGLAWDFGDPESWQLRATWIHASKEAQS
ncbi:MAG: hypothetical protein Q7O66_07230 [Dehalococcoidia bacterium]|nr:hypothetical protein [Dehalococcoidia bacterium]